MWNERSLAEGIEDVERVGSLGDQKKLPNMPPPDLAVPRPDEDPNRLSDGEEEDESCRRLMRLWREPITYTPRRKKRHVGQHRNEGRVTEDTEKRREEGAPSRACLFVLGDRDARGWSGSPGQRWCFSVNQNGDRRYQSARWGEKS